MDYRFQPHELVQDSKVFGEALLRVRTELDVPRKGLGEHALIAPSTIATYETGAREPSVEAIVGIAVTCGVEPWSAAQHGHLLLSNRVMRLDPSGLPLLFIPASRSGSARSKTVEPASVAAAVVASVSVALAGAAVASAVRRKRGEASVFEVSHKKLIVRAQAATPLPGAVELGCYPLVEPKDPEELRAALLERSRELSQDELTALVAALPPPGGRQREGADP